MRVPIDLLLFDLDGTLADTKDDIATAVNLTLRDFGLPIQVPERIHAFVGDGVRALLARAFDGREPGDFDRALGVFRRHYLTHLLDMTQFYPAVLPLLTHFAGKKKAIVTNKPIEYTLKLLEGLKATEHFTLILGAGSSPDLKPHPGMINKALADLGVSKERAVMIGDHINDIVAARAAGVRSVAVGYGFGDPTVLREAGPDYFCETLEEVTALFE